MSRQRPWSGRAAEVRAHGRGGWWKDKYKLKLDCNYPHSYRERQLRNRPTMHKESNKMQGRGDAAALVRGPNKGAIDAHHQPPTNRPSSARRWGRGIWPAGQGLARAAESVRLAMPRFLRSASVSAVLGRLGSRWQGGGKTGPRAAVAGRPWRSTFYKVASDWSVQREAPPNESLAFLILTKYPYLRPCLRRRESACSL
jgi:hypothetical protein